MADAKKAPASVIRQTVAPGFFGDPLQWYHRGKCHEDEAIKYPTIDWVIVGGESGPRSRPFWAPWARTIVQQCKAAGTAVFVKQMGANVQDRNDAGFDDCENGWNLEDEIAQVEHDINGFREDHQGAAVRIRLRDRKGGDMAEWPEDLRVPEFPR